MGSYSCLYLLMEREVISSPFLLRYLAAHPVSHVATAMFCVGIAALVLKAIDIAGQYVSLNQISLPNASSYKRVTTLGSQEGESTTHQYGQSIDECGKMLESLDESPPSARESYLWRRLHDAVLMVGRKSSANTLDDELKYLADMDAANQHESYSLVRILIWAIPMLGFLGTVIGISAALGGLSIGPNQDFEAMMSGLRSSLYVAFDTTALALTLSIVMMFVQFVVDRFETQLLSAVDARVNAELVGRFEQLGNHNDPFLQSIEKMNLAVLTSVDELVHRQSALWQESISQAHAAWSKSSENVNQHLQDNLAESLTKSLHDFSNKMSQTNDRSEQQLSQRWEQWQEKLTDSARLMQEQQVEISRQSQVMSNAITATADVIKLEDVLNHNLNALAGSKNFEDTVMSLSAAIHLLNSKLEVGNSQKIELNSSESDSERAA